MSIENDQHATEVRGGRRFEFGKNWSRFLTVLNDDRIALAQGSLRSMLGLDRLDGRTFLDVGSGSGLFSLAARRLGAKVHSFDYDPQSVACTRELKRRYCDGDDAWTIERGSVLDQGYLGNLGTFDIVYSWGVLHHTGQMWHAMDNVKPLVNMGGLLFIAIYNDEGEITDRWAEVKQRYNSLPHHLASLYALKIITREECRSLLGCLRQRDIKPWLHSWTGYAKQSTRGMSKFHDWIDWIGGQPYERATLEQVADYYAKDGFRFSNFVDRSGGHGCNEFVFCRVAPMGVWIDSPILAGRSFARLYGKRVIGQVEQSDGMWIGRVSAVPPVAPGAELLLFRDGRLVGPVRTLDCGAIQLAKVGNHDREIRNETFCLVEGYLRPPPSKPFVRERGRMWRWSVPELTLLADNSHDGSRRSPVYVFEGGVQLPWPHALHNDIARVGHGRFSHWGPQVYFSTLANSDPNRIRDQLRLVIAATPQIDAAASMLKLVNSGNE